MVSVLIWAGNHDQWETVDNILFGKWRYTSSLQIFAELLHGRNMKCKPGRWIFIQCELELSKIMNIVCPHSRLPPEVLPCPWRSPSRPGPLLTGGDRDELEAGAVDRRPLLYEGHSSIPDTSAPGWGTPFGAEGVLCILKYTTQISASSMEYAKIISGS